MKIRQLLFCAALSAAFCLAAACGGGGSDDGNNDIDTPNPQTGLPSAATPAPVSTPVDVADGIDCQQVNERSYTGDGGCGVGTVDLSRTGTTVVLEPFGVNGATSFSQLAGDPSQAQSSRIDLAINGIPGYSCSIQCNGQITFEVECFLEGADSCTEKF